MKFKQPLQAAVLVRRYKRFLADVQLPSGEIITVHCPNSGAMLGCRAPGLPAYISRSENPTRKYPHTLEMVRNHGTWIGINTALTNHLVREAMELGLISELNPTTNIQAEVKISPHSRIDFLIRQPTCLLYLEVKNCTLAEGGVARFPDAVTSRGAKHLRELMTLKEQGHQAAVLFCVQRQDTDRFAPADRIDPHYALLLKQAHAQGVLVLAYQAEVGPTEIRLARPLPVYLD